MRTSVFEHKLVI